MSSVRRPLLRTFAMTSGRPVARALRGERADREVRPGRAAGADRDVHPDADSVDEPDAACGRGWRRDLGPDDRVALAGRRMLRHLDRHGLDCLAVPRGTRSSRRLTDVQRGKLISGVAGSEGEPAASEAGGGRIDPDVAVELVLLLISTRRLMLDPGATRSTTYDARERIAAEAGAHRRAGFRCCRSRRARRPGRRSRLAATRR